MALADTLGYVAAASPLFADLQVYRLGWDHLGAGGHGLYAARAVNDAPFTYPPIAAILLTITLVRYWYAIQWSLR